MKKKSIGGVIVVLVLSFSPYFLEIKELHMNRLLEEEIQRHYEKKNFYNRI